jgi:hypothetical protein
MGAYLEFNTNWDLYGIFFVFAWDRLLRVYDMGIYYQQFPDNYLIFHVKFLNPLRTLAP